MIKFIQILFIYLTMISSAWADSLSFAEMQSFLRSDLQSEIDTADFLNSTSLAQIQDQTPIDLKKIIPIKISVSPVPGKKISEEHAISNINNYIGQRLGAHVLTALQKHHLEVQAFAGTKPAFMEFARRTYPRLQQIVRIPSLYEEWGIAKYLVRAEGRDSVLFFNIPPSLLYAQHYATMIGYASQKSGVFVSLDRASVQIEAQKFDLAAQRIKAQLSHEYDVVSFGYSPVWLESLQSSSTWRLVKKESVQDKESGISVDLLSIQHTSKLTTHYVLLLSSKKTVWGELASMMLSGFLHPRLTAAIFMGSAGAVSNKNSIYDLSVPKIFNDATADVPIQNMLSIKADSAQEDINFGAKHGNTFSPMEQDLSFLRNLGKLDFDTIDVEQSILAKTISDYNQTKHLNIRFGAINLITDKPYDALFAEKNHHDLDRVDKTKKALARRRAVGLALLGLDSMPAKLQCQNLFAGGM